MTGRVVLLLALLAALIPAPAGAAEPRTSLPDIEDEVMCVSCDVALNVAESPQAYRQRELIRGLIAQGLTKDEIKDRLVAEYGKDVLAMPEGGGGVSAAAYAVPLAAVLALLAVGAVLLPRWRRRARVAPAPTPATAGAPATDVELQRLDEDLRRYD